MKIRHSPTLILGWEDLLPSVRKHLEENMITTQLDLASIKDRDFSASVKAQIRLHTTVIFRYFAKSTLIKFVP